MKNFESIINIESFIVLAKLVEIILSTMYPIRYKFFHKNSVDTFDAKEDVI